MSHRGTLTSARIVAGDSDILIEGRVVEGVSVEVTAAWHGAQPWPIPLSAADTVAAEAALFDASGAELDRVDE